MNMTKKTIIRLARNCVEDSRNRIGILLLAVSLIATTAIVLAQSAKNYTVAWDDPNGEELGVTSYVVYERIDDQWVPLGETLEKTFEITVTDNKPHTYAVTAKNEHDESDPSNSVTVGGKPEAPTNVRVTVTVQVNP